MAAIAGVAVCGLIVHSGLSGSRLTLVLAAFGLAIVAGTFGYVVQKAAAGQLLDLAHQAPPVYRGGQ